MDQETFRRLEQHGGDMRGDWKNDVEGDPIAEKVFFHSEWLMFWSSVGLISVLAVAGLVFRDAVSHISVPQILSMWGFSVAVLVFLKSRGYFEDRPDEDIRAFAIGGRWFQAGALLGAAYFFWDEGFAWIVAYDLTNVDFHTGFSPLGAQSKAVGLAGFLEKIVRLLTIALGGGALVKAVAEKVGLKT